MLSRLTKLSFIVFNGGGEDWLKVNYTWKFDLNMFGDFTMLMFFIKIEKLDYEFSYSNNEHDYNW